MEVPNDISQSWRNADILTCLSSTSIRFQLLLFECSNFVQLKTVNFSHKPNIFQMFLRMLVFPQFQRNRN